MAGNTNYQGLNTHTLEELWTSAKTQWLEDYPITKLIKSKGGVKSLPGGTKFIVPLVHGNNTSFQFTSSIGEVNLAEQNVADVAEFDWRRISIGFLVKKWDLVMNRGDRAQIVDLLKTLRMQMLHTFAENVENYLILGQTTDPITGEATFNGLLDILSTTNTYGGIAKTTDTWWQPQVEFGGGGTSASEGIDDVGLVDWYQLLRKVGGDSGIDKPTVILCDDYIWDYLAENKVFAQYDYNQNPNTPTLGVPSLNFLGIPIIATSNSNWTQYTVAFLNMNYIQLVEPSGFSSLDVEVHDQVLGKYAKAVQAFWSANLACNNCSRQGLITYTAND